MAHRVAVIAVRLRRPAPTRRHGYLIAVKAGAIGRRRAAYRAHISRRRRLGMPIPAAWWALAGTDPNESGGLRRVAARQNSARRSIERAANRAQDRFGIEGARDDAGIAGISRTERAARQAFLAEANRLLSDPKFDGIDPSPGQVSWIARKANVAAKRAVEQALARENRPGTADAPDAPEPEPFDRAKALEDARRLSDVAAQLVDKAGWTGPEWQAFSGDPNRNVRRESESAVKDPTDDEIRDFLTTATRNHLAHAVPQHVAKNPEFQRRRDEAIDAAVREFFTQPDKSEFRTPAVSLAGIEGMAGDTGRKTITALRADGSLSRPFTRESGEAEQALRDVGNKIHEIVDNDPEIAKLIGQFDAANVAIAAAREAIGGKPIVDTSRSPKIVDATLRRELDEALAGITGPDGRPISMVGRTEGEIEIGGAGIRLGYSYEVLPDGRVIPGSGGSDPTGNRSRVASFGRIDPALVTRILEAARVNDQFEVGQRINRAWLVAAVADRNNARLALKAARSEKRREVLGEIRPMGGRIETLEEAGRKPSRSRARKAIDGAAEFLPTDWVKAMNENAIAGLSFNASGAGGGVYYPKGRGSRNETGRRFPGKPYIIASPDSAVVGDPDVPTTLHELTHHAERQVPGLLAAETTFYRRRTMGETAVRRGEVVSREDEFGYFYAGRDYQRGGDAWEVTTMGLETTFTADRFDMDSDYESFILGAMATLGRRSDDQPDPVLPVVEREKIPAGRPRAELSQNMARNARYYRDYAVRDGQVWAQSTFRWRPLGNSVVLVSPAGDVYVTHATRAILPDGRIQAFPVTGDSRSSEWGEMVTLPSLPDDWAIPGNFAEMNKGRKNMRNR